MAHNMHFFRMSEPLQQKLHARISALETKGCNTVRSCWSPILVFCVFAAIQSNHGHNDVFCFCVLFHNLMSTDGLNVGNTDLALSFDTGEILSKFFMSGIDMPCCTRQLPKLFLMGFWAQASSGLGLASRDTNGALNKGANYTFISSPNELALPTRNNESLIRRLFHITTHKEMGLIVPTFVS